MMNITDLSPDSLAALEAKLVSDLEMVRRVRALVTEYRGEVRKAEPPAPPTSGRGGEVNSFPAPPRVVVGLTDALLNMPEAGFTPGMLARECLRVGQRMESSELKNALRRMVSQGKVRVVEVRTGRSGSLYQSLLPRPMKPEEAGQSDPVSS